MIYQEIDQQLQQLSARLTSLAPLYQVALWSLSTGGDVNDIASLSGISVKTLNRLVDDLSTP